MASTTQKRARTNASVSPRDTQRSIEDVADVDRVKNSRREVRFNLGDSIECTVAAQRVGTPRKRVRWNPTVTTVSESDGNDRRRDNPGDQLWVDSWDEELWLARACGLAEPHQRDSQPGRRPSGLSVPIARAGYDNSAAAGVPSDLDASIVRPDIDGDGGVRHPCGLNAPIACAGDVNGAAARVPGGLDTPIARPDIDDDGDVRHPCGLNAPIACAGDASGEATQVPCGLDASIAQPVNVLPPVEQHPKLTRINCAADFDHFWHGGHDFEGNYASTTARSGALRRGASREQMNGTAWEPWSKVQRECLPGTPVFKPEASPLRPDYIMQQLASHPVRDFADAVGDMLLNGASLGADDYDVTGSRVQPNLRSSDLHPKPIAAWIADENGKGRLDGPHEANPHPYMQYWGVGAVQKGDFDIDEKCRVITHHSQSEDGRPSLNEGVSKEEASLKLTRIVDAVHEIERRRAAGHRPVIALADLRSAYRNILVRRADLLLTGIRFPNPETGVMEHHFDRCLGFGGRRSARTFDALASALHYIIERKWGELGISAELFHYLDDFCLIADDDESAAAAFRVVCGVFADAGCPVAKEKTQPPCRRAVYLGLTLDLDTYTVSLPDLKRGKMCDQLDQLADGTRPAMTKVVAGVAGKLGFAGVCFPALRPLINPFYDSFTPALRDGRSWCSPSGDMRRAAAVFSKAIKKDPHTPFGAFSATPTDADMHFSVWTRRAGRVSGGSTPATVSAARRPCSTRDGRSGSTWIRPASVPGCRRFWL